MTIILKIKLFKYLAQIFFPDLVASTFFNVITQFFHSMAIDAVGLVDHEGLQFFLFDVDLYILWQESVQFVNSLRPSHDELGAFGIPLLQAGVFLDCSLKSQDVRFDAGIVPGGEVVDVFLDVRLAQAQDQVDEERLGGRIKVALAVSEEIFDVLLTKDRNHHAGSGQDFEDDEADSVTNLDRVGDVLEPVLLEEVILVRRVQHFDIRNRVASHGRVANVRKAELFPVLRDVNGRRLDVLEDEACFLKCEHTLEEIGDDEWRLMVHGRPVANNRTKRACLVIELEVGCGSFPGKVLELWQVLVASLGAQHCEIEGSQGFLRVKFIVCVDPEIKDDEVIHVGEVWLP